MPEGHHVPEHHHDDALASRVSRLETLVESIATSVSALTREFKNEHSLLRREISETAKESRDRNKPNLGWIVALISLVASAGVWVATQIVAPVNERIDAVAQAGSDNYERSREEFASINTDIVNLREFSASSLHNAQQIERMWVLWVDALRLEGETKARLEMIEDTQRALSGRQYEGNAGD